MKEIDSKEDVESFLTQVKRIIGSVNFNESDFIFIRNRRQYEKNNKYTNESTILELNYNVKDVINEILTLKTSDYLETVIDDMPHTINRLYCFIKYIKCRNVYIKFKIKEKDSRKIICISFHFAEYQVNENDFPYGEN